MTTILVIDDDPDLRKIVETSLRKEGFEIETASSGVEGLRKAFQVQPDLILLDVMMPGVDGIEICERLRQLSDTPIIMLTALSAEGDIVRGLSAGADDYITKPFGMSELVARVRAALRRWERPNDADRSNVATINDLTIDFARHRVTVRGEVSDLSPTEFRLLAYLVRHRGSVIPHATLLAEVWGPEYRDQLEYLRLYIRYLRQKLEEDPSKPQIIKTEWGIGYYIDG